MWPDWVSNPGPLTYESGALPTALQGPAILRSHYTIKIILMCKIPGLQIRRSNKDNLGIIIQISS